MSTLLVNPPYIKKVYGTKQALSIRPPLGLAYVAASVEKAGLSVEILDANAEFLSPEETSERIINSQAQNIGFTAVTATMPLVYEICSLVKEKDRGKLLFVGGPHVTFLSKQTIKECPAIDVVVKGEGEITAVELINALEEGKNLTGIGGITFRAEKEIFENSDRELIKDINTIPFPARHLLPFHLYSPSSLGNLGFKGSQYTSVMTARGCPNRCVFCSSASFWRKVRARSPENVVAELEFLVKRYGLRHVDFLDDTIILSKERMAKICRLILDKKLNIKWSCYARVNHITEELVELMKEAGCKFVQFGIESGNQEVLNQIQKHITLDQIRRATKIVKKANLKLMGDFMIGLPGDTRETVNQTIEFAKELNPNFAFFSITTPFPGTPLYEDYRKLNRLTGNYWQNMNLHVKTEFSTPTLTNQELENLYFKAHHRFYYRPAYVWQTLKWLIRNPYELKNFYSLAKLQIIREWKKFFK